MAWVYLVIAGGLEVFWSTFLKLSGLFYWTGFDYRGEPNPLEYAAHDS